MSFTHDRTSLTFGAHDIMIDVAEEGVEAEPIGESVVVKHGLGGAAVVSTNKNRSYKVTVNLLQGSEGSQYLRAYNEATVATGAEFPMDLYIASTGERITSAFATVTKSPKFQSKKEAGIKTWEITARRCVVMEDQGAGSIAVALAGVADSFNFLN